MGDGVVAGGSREDEDDGGQHGQVVERLDELAATRARQPGVPHTAGASGQTRHPLVEGQGLGMGLAAVEQRHELDPTAPLLGDGDVVAQLDGAMLLDDDFGGTAHAGEPGTELLGIGHRGRQAHEHDLGRGEDDHLFPHRPPVGVLEVVHLVEHHQAEPVELRGAGEEHVAQDLGRHHDHGGVGSVRDVAGQEPHRVGSVHLGQFASTSGWTAP